MKNTNSIFYVLICLLLFAGCEGGCKREQPTIVPQYSLEIPAPAFNADSAYFYIEKQVAFGPRVPNTQQHIDCGNWLESKLLEFTDKVYIQEGQVTAFDGTKLNFKNIIGAFNPENKNRILLAAHWDTRPFADQDADPSKRDTPIDGANDGASGVGVLLEIARQLKANRVNIGVDIILFDAEDYGQPENSKLPQKPDSYCLGSQYWAKKPHVQGYRAKYGILLDMVGAKGSTFLMETYSVKYAPSLVRRVWNNAAHLGFSNYFLFKNTPRPIIDDHYYINVIAGIPTIDIIHVDQSLPNMFGKFWHTHDDTMELIDTNTLKAVGITVLFTLYQEEKGLL